MDRKHKQFLVWFLSWKDNMYSSCSSTRRKFLTSYTVMQPTTTSFKCFVRNFVVEIQTVAFITDDLSPLHTVTVILFHNTFMTE